MAKRSEDEQIRLDAEAAAWVARLGHEGRSDLDTAAFRAWIDEDLRHRTAFESASSTWQLASALKHSSLRSLHGHRAPRFSPQRRVLLGGALAAAASVAGLGVWGALTSETQFVTGVGEQRRVALADGSLVTLDSDTTLRVRLSSTRRAISLIDGRAHFDVAKDPLRPFVVRAAGRQVVAIGTAFDVSRDESSITVVLVEGRVAVEPLAGAQDRRRAMMSAGERMVFAADGHVSADRPDLAKLTAWRTGRLMFDNDTLASAVEEMNRYSRRPIVIADRRVGELLISGIYTAGDVEAFATSISMVLPVEVVPESSRLTLVAARSTRRVNSN